MRDTVFDTHAVNFINILRTNFADERRFGGFFYLHAHLLTTYLKAAETMFVRKIRTYNVDEIHYW
jgi:hypothetical protein